MAQSNGGIIGQQNTTSSNGATGVWTMRDMELAQQAGKWPPTFYQYVVQRSLRFNSADSAYLSRTPAVAGNRRTWTISFWVKKTVNGASYTNIFGAGDSASNRCDILWHPSDYLRFYDYNNACSWFAAPIAGSSTWTLFRDTSAWYHIVIAVDTTQAVNADRVKGYVNGVFVPGTIDTYTQNAQTTINSTIPHTLGAHAVYGQYMNGYLAEVHFVDGQQLPASSFGENNADTGAWQPKAYTGTYGTNGFKLNFSDNSNTTAATLGKDSSPNGNNWTPNNFSVTAGVGNDSLVDTPTAYGTDTGVGGTVRGNYATLNPINKGTSATLANGNLDYTSNSATSDTRVYSSIGMSSGKWYCEYVPTGGTTNLPVVGIALSTESPNAGYVGATSGSYGYYANNGGKYNNNGNTGYGASYGLNDVIGVAFDADAGTLTFYKNGVSQGVAFTSIPAGTYFFAEGDYTGSYTGTFNFGQRPFAYTAPSGYKALCTQNLPTPAVGAAAGNQGGNHFNAITFTGNSANPRSFTGFGFSPDLIWSARRDVSYGIQVFDIVRGAGKRLNLGYSSLTTAAEDTGYGLVNSFDADGYSSNAVDQASNYSGGSYVTWAWNAGESTVSNTAGSTTSSVRANPTAGISVLTYTGNASGGVTIGHGLGVAPAMVIVRNRGGGTDWIVGHTSIGWTNFLKLNSNAASASYAVWNNTAPTSTVVTLGSDGAVNGSTASMVAYCFAEVNGFSKFSSYTGNGSADGPFVYCGFKPKYILLKKSSSTDEWFIWDTVRSTINQITGGYLCTSTTAVEGTTYAVMDVVSNGFKIRGTDTSWNLNGATYIFAAFAEAPFKYALAR